MNKRRTQWRFVRYAQNNLYSPTSTSNWTMKDIIKMLLHEWKEKHIPQTLNRGYDFSAFLTEPKKISVMSGFRRTGKTYLIYQYITQLLKIYDREEVVYLNFEDERVPKTIEFLTNLIPTIREVHGRKLRILFLDEVQAIDGWGSWLRRIYDSEDFFLFVTGSSSKLSTKEIPTELRGRSLNKEVLPLSFREFLSFKEYVVDEDSVLYSSHKRAEMFNLTEEFITFGGLPEIVLSSKERKTEILQNYYATVVQKDIVERFSVRNEEGLKTVLRLLVNSSAYSLTKLYNILKTTQTSIGKTTLLNYVSYAHTAYFLHSVPIFSRKIKDHLHYPRKVYLVDTGFLKALALRFSDKVGQLYENTVFIELLRRKKFNQDIYYYRSQEKEEVDFVIQEGERTTQLIQVCHTIADFDTKKRETRALIKASKELNCDNVLIITSDKQGSEEMKGKMIVYLPLWKWLLEE